MTSTAMVAGLVGSLGWGIVTLARLRVPSLALAIAVIGCASASGVPVVIVARAVRPTRAAIGTTVLAALSSLVPVGLLAAAIKTHTHHRALGAVTFAVGGVGTVLVIRWIVRRAVDGSRPYRGQSIVIVFIALVALLSSVWALVALLGSLSPPGVRAATVDGLTAVLALGAATALPTARFPKWPTVVAAAIFILAASVGVATALDNARIFAVLCARAPITLGAPGIFECP